MLDIKINNDCQRDVEIVGNEETPVLTIDNLIESTGALIDYASEQAEYSFDSGFSYPGIRATLPSEYVRELAPQLISLISHEYNVPRSYKPTLIHQLFSLVCQKPEELQLLQRMPHIDNRSPYYFATVHYLSDSNHAGTGFFRHRPTQYERISEERFELYKQAAIAHMEAHGQPEPKYINGSNDQFELIGKVDHSPNRLAIYPGNLLHSGLINPDIDIDDNPSTGRLTANLFFYFTPT